MTLGKCGHLAGAPEIPIQYVEGGARESVTRRRSHTLRNTAPGRQVRGHLAWQPDLARGINKQ